VRLPRRLKGPGWHESKTLLGVCGERFPWPRDWQSGSVTIIVIRRKDTIEAFGHDTRPEPLDDTQTAAACQSLGPTLARLRILYGCSLPTHGLASGGDIFVAACRFALIHRLEEHSAYSQSGWCDQRPDRRAARLAMRWWPRPALPPGAAWSERSLTQPGRRLLMSYRNRGRAGP